MMLECTVADAVEGALVDGSMNIESFNRPDSTIVVVKWKYCPDAVPFGPIAHDVAGMTAVVVIARSKTPIGSQWNLIERTPLNPFFRSEGFRHDSKLAGTD